MVEATSDIAGLHYYVYTPSLTERRLDRAECLLSIEMIDSAGLGALLGVTGPANISRPVRTIFF
jgi:sulfur relay (sulfurtransferase) DsrF/TusC family protein